MIVTIVEYVTAHAAELTPRTRSTLLRASDSGELQSWTLARLLGAVSAGTITEVRNMGAGVLSELRGLSPIPLEDIPALPQCVNCREPILLFYDWVGEYCSHRCQGIARKEQAKKVEAEVKSETQAKATPSERDRSILAARARGESYRAIGKVFGISHGRVGQICDRWRDRLA